MIFNEELKQELMYQFIEMYINDLCSLGRKDTQIQILSQQTIKNNALEKEVFRYINDYISPYLTRCIEVSKLHFDSFSEIHSDYVVAEFHGGLNGSGNWSEYIYVINGLFNILQPEYNCWLVSLVNDCPDDVFTLKIGISRKNG